VRSLREDVLTGAEPPPSLGALLRHYRRAAGLIQGELAERAGLCREAIETLERGARRTPRKETLALLAEALALDPDDRSAFALAARRPPAATLAATPATGFALDGHDGHAEAAATVPATFPPPRTEVAWPWLRANLALAGVLTLILVALAVLLLPLVVPTFPRAVGLVAGGAALALLVAGGVAALFWRRAQAPGTPWSQVVAQSLAALWRAPQRGGPAIISLLLSATLVGTLLYVTRPAPFTLPSLGGYDSSYTYHKPTHTGGSAVIWTTSPIHTLVSPALFNFALPDEVYPAVWDACLVRLPDLNPTSLEGWRPDQCTTVPSVTNGDEDPSLRWTTFRIDPRAKWSDGQPLTADDFLFAFRLIQDPNVLGSMDPCPCNDINPPWSLMQLSKLNPSTIRIDWTKPYYDYLTALAQLFPLPLHEYMSGTFAGVFNPTTGAYNSALARRMARTRDFNLGVPVDNGPFVARQVNGYPGPPGDYKPDDVSTARELVLARNPHFFSNFLHTPVALEQVTFKTLFSFPYDPLADEKMISFYRQGGVTVVDRLEPPDFASLKDIPNAKVEVGGPGKGVLALWFNQRTAAPSAHLNGGEPIFTDPRVRKAFVEAFDRCGALRAELGLRDCHDRTFVTDEPAVPGKPGYDPNVTLPAFNPTDAAKLLDSAGFPVVHDVRRFQDGTTPLTLTLTLRVSHRGLPGLCPQAAAGL
jgi:ABC-type transport system substrate-binding protein/transcriptional regulator with XRE-family HTH domain